MKELRESVSKSYNDQLNELNESLEVTKKELTEINKSSAEQKHAIEDLNERLSAALQSRTDADEIMKRYSGIVGLEFTKVTKFYLVYCHQLLIGKNGCCS